MMRGGFVLGFEVVEVGLLLLEGGEGFAFANLVAKGGSGSAS